MTKRIFWELIETLCSNMEIFRSSLRTLILVASGILFEILFLLGHVEAGFFTAVNLAPPASTWSRIRHSSSSGQPAQNERTPNRTQSSQSRGIEQTNRDSNMGVRASCPSHSEKSLGPTGLPGRPGRTRAERTDIHLGQQPLTKTGRRK